MSNITHSNPSAHARSLASPTLFGLLAQELQEQLRATGPVRVFDPGQIVQQRGETPDGFWLIESGAVVVGQFMEDGEFRAVAHMQPGDSYGELARLAGKPTVVDAVARTRCNLRWIGGARYEAALAGDPSSVRRLLSGLAEQLQETINLVTGHRGGGSAARIAHFLTNLSAGGPVLALGQQELADLAGVTRVTVNHALRALEEDGCISRGYRKITVLDRDRLKEWL